MTAFTSKRSLEPGTTGWSVHDLADTAIARAWEEGRMEIVEGVLVQMPAAYYDHNDVTLRLLFVVEQQLRTQGVDARSSAEVDIVVDEDHVLRADGVLTLPGDREAQANSQDAARGTTEELGRLVVPPTLVVESVSRHHERHDYHTKRRLYERFGVPHYWIVNRFDQSVVCLRLADGKYVEQRFEGREATATPAGLPRVELPLAEVFRA